MYQRKDVTIVIPTGKGRRSLLKRLLDSIPDGMDILIVDDEDMSLSEKRNFGLLQAKGRFVLFIDDDNELCVFSIDRLLDCFNDDKVAIAGMVAVFDEGEPIVSDSGAFRNLTMGYTTDRFFKKTLIGMWTVTNKPYEVDEVANCFMVRRKLFLEIGGFDTGRFPIDLDEADLCLRAKGVGYKIVVHPASITKHHSFTHSRIPDFRRRKNAYYMARNRFLFQKKHNLPMYFMPLFVFVYVGVLLVRWKPLMIYHFLKGVAYGVFNRSGNLQEYKNDWYTHRGLFLR